MIKSMTGFGKATGEHASKNITVEIKSLNSKSFDLSVRLPGTFKEKDLELRSRLNKELERGKIDFLVYFEQATASKKQAINQPLALAYFHELKQLGDAIQQTNPDYLSALLHLPGVMESEQSSADEAEWATISQIIQQALEAFNKFRADEGRELGKELSARIHTILQHLKTIESMDALRVNHVRERINNSLSELIEAGKIDRNRFEQELIYYIEKIDITEEKFRLQTHCDYFLATLEEPVNNGKKLGFITQEIGREINTIGSKANDAGVQKFVVQMKDELEKIKEQALNVL
jgi:uncharacterized protein (TIGR00255 family)